MSFSNLSIHFFLLNPEYPFSLMNILPKKVIQNSSLTVSDLLAYPSIVSLCSIKLLSRFFNLF